MTTKKKEPTTTAELLSGGKKLHVDLEEAERLGVFPYLAREIISPELAAYSVANSGNPLAQHLDLKATTEELRAQAAAVHTGDLRRAESMLMGQATGLQSLFASLVNRAHGSELLPQFETYMRLALKAQSQCRATLETLANIKNPPVVYARQTNIAHGPQQVNNTVTADGRVRENDLTPNQQSGGRRELRQDAGTSPLAVGSHTPMETVGGQHRT